MTPLGTKKSDHLRMKKKAVKMNYLLHKLQTNVQLSWRPRKRGKTRRRVIICECYTQWRTNVKFQINSFLLPFRLILSLIATGSELHHRRLKGKAGFPFMLEGLHAKAASFEETGQATLPSLPRAFHRFSRIGMGNEGNYGAMKPLRRRSDV